MLNKIASSILGFSKLGVFISGDELVHTDSSNYTIDHLEDIYYLIKTKTDEYCFTNRAVIHVDGRNSDAKRNVLHRFDYNMFVLHDIYLETASNMDIDAELRITLKDVKSLKPKEHIKHPPLKAALEKESEIVFSIAIHRDFLIELRALYKTLLLIKQKQFQNLKYLDTSENLFGLILSSVAAKKNDSSQVTFQEVMSFVDKWLEQEKNSYSNEDFREIFEQNFPSMMLEQNTEIED